jgi:hypothetical protein
LASVGPLIDIRDIVRLGTVSYLISCGGLSLTTNLVHDAEEHLGLAGVLGGQLLPKANELVIRRATLADDTAVPPSVYSEEVRSLSDKKGASKTHNCGSAKKVSKGTGDLTSREN